MDHLEMELQRLSRGYTSRLGIVQMDLDYLKDVNDRFGHQTGDRYIQAFAEALRQSVRETDIAGRIGGDEFALVLLEVESVQVVLEILRRIQQAWEQLVGEALHSLASFSAGVVMIPAQGEARTYSLDQVYARVDEALYQAKNLGRSRVVYEGESSGVLRLKEEPS
jgi:diguanylate cyclase (GGDEF)-like protein